MAGSLAPIFLDYNSTTPVAPEVVDSMLPYLREHFGNPSSRHVYGVVAREAVDAAREAVGGLIGANGQDLLFTSGGTESNNLALAGVVRGGRNGRDHIVTSAVEHPAVREPLARLARDGIRVTTLPVDEQARVDPADLERVIGSDTLLVTVMHANNEVGTLQPISELAEIAHAHGALLHTDAAQSVGKVPVDVTELAADLLTIAGHKMYAPKGVGALYVRPGIPLQPILHGAGHERGLRPGTEAVAQIVALGAAARLAHSLLPEEGTRLQELRDRLEDRLHRELGADRIRTNGHPVHRLPNTLNVSIRGCRGDALLETVGDRVAASAGSACHAHEVRLSPVLEAMGTDPEWGMGTLRLSVGRYTTEHEVDQAADVVAKAVGPSP